MKSRKKFDWFIRAGLAVAIMLVSYGLYRVAAHNNWIIVTRCQRSFEPGVEPQRDQSRKQLSLIVVGDTGKNTQSRTQVVRAMQKHVAWSVPDAAILLGDNFYESGVESVDDPRFRSDFEELFAATSFDFPFYVCLGNHDHYGNVDGQVKYTERSHRWKMPRRYYQLQHQVGSVSIGLFVLDTVPIHEGDDTAPEQLDWLEQELAASDATWKIVLGHHPAISGGKHEASAKIAEWLPPIFESRGVDLYLSGHDHDLQLSDSGRGWLQVVSGAGSKLRSTAWIEETIFAKATPGFCWLLVEEDQLLISFYSADTRLYTHRIPRSPHDRTSRPTKPRRKPAFSELLKA